MEIALYYLAKQKCYRSIFWRRKQPSPLLTSFIGDYLAIAIGDEQLIYDDSYAVKGSHAGYTKEERMIPIICFQKEDEAKKSA